jgi:hypothetical protein
VRTTTTDVRPAKFTTHVTLCDICGIAIRSDTFTESSEANVVGHSCKTSELNATKSAHYGWGSDSDKIAIDCCYQCFVDKVVPLIEKHLGCKFSNSKTESED